MAFYAAAARGDDAPPKSLPAGDCFYLPPSWADRVGFYHSFESGVERPEINRIDAKMFAAGGESAPGFAGKGCRLPLGQAKNAALEISSPALSAHRPITLMCWFRLDRPMTETTGFALLTLRGSGPYIAHFVAGKGPWCRLKEPTYISQVIAFPGITQYNNAWGGRAWFDAGVWHHVAMTVANSSEIRIYRDGALCETIIVKGRMFKDQETTTAAFGSSGHPMTIDEVLVLDRRLRRRRSPRTSPARGAQGTGVSRRWAGKRSEMSAEAGKRAAAKTPWRVACVAVPGRYNRDRMA